jgi:hypothetical protein
MLPWVGSPRRRDESHPTGGRCKNDKTNKNDKTDKTDKTNKKYLSPPP